MSISKIKSEKELNIFQRPCPTLELFRKTMFTDIFTLPKFLGSLFAMIFVPLILILGIYIPAVNKTTPLFESMGLGYVVLVYNLSIVFPIIISLLTAPLISREVKEGTMEILLSKSITRSKVVLSKFLAVFTFGVILSITSFFVICLIAYIRYPFYDIIPFFFINVIYSLIVLIFFECLTMAMSCLLRKPINVITIPLIVVIFLFLVLFMVRIGIAFSMGGRTTFYEKYQIYNFDLGYHFINIFYYLSKLIQIENYVFFEVNGLIRSIVEDQVVIGYEDTSYWAPLGSLILLLSIAVLLLVIGFIFFKKKDIHR